MPLKRDIYRLDFICNIFLSRDFLPIYNLEISVFGEGGEGQRIEGFCTSAWKELWATHHSQMYLPSVLMLHFKPVFSLGDATAGV